MYCYLHLGCHSDCSNCTGPYMSDCDECADPLMIYNTLTSICECPPIKYKYNGKCLGIIYIHNIYTQYIYI